ncbi:hypothetical protein CL654_00210 [bacterium]|nr:hypothetical protein [bacterium]|tara:strand:- start:2917 stop:4386 length:1470 start_codon:yes stop_codon:yes gene_type:complete
MDDKAIPQEVKETVKTLENKGFLAYVVGGSVRDILRGKTPKDWDITTNAKPEDIEASFPKTFYNNSFGTVTVVHEEAKDPSVKEIQITPFRVESKYSDKRHPDKITFSDNVEDDLKRRDFTMNAIALDISKGHFIDLYKGQEDIKEGVIKAVGDAKERLSEDALRIMRAVRLAGELGFTINIDLVGAIKELAPSLNDIAMERIQDEFSKIVMSDNPKEAFELMHKLGILEVIVPELLEGVGIGQNQAHSYEVFEHNLRCLQHAANRKFPFHVRLAALFHDVAKPATRKWGEKNKDWTFYGHDVVGGRMTKKILTRMKFSRETTELVTKLVRYHLFFSDPDVVTMSAVRRLVRNMGKDHIWDLMNVRACDRIGTGRPKEAPYRLRKYESMIEQALADPISVGMLKMDGETIMKTTDTKPGPRIGWILHALLEEVLEDPKKNTEEYLGSRVTELNTLSDEELKSLGEKGKEKKEEKEEEQVEEIRKKHWVK